MAQTIKAKNSLVKWCDEQVAAGHTLSMGWEGGGDSGWCYFEIDGEKVEEGKIDQVDRLVDLMYDQLDYGSWAGEFSAMGQADYDPQDKSFSGTDYYSEDDTEYHRCEIEVRIPKHLWFDSFEYNMEDEDPTVNAALVIKNGFMIEKHEETTTRIEKELKEKVDQEINKFIQGLKSGDYRNMWVNERVERSEFKEDGDDLVYTIKELAIGTYTTDDKIIYLNIESIEDHDDE